MTAGYKPGRDFPNSTLRPISQPCHDQKRHGPALPCPASNHEPNSPLICSTQLLNALPRLALFVPCLSALLPSAGLLRPLLLLSAACCSIC